jgi:hypothetical protein
MAGMKHTYYYPYYQCSSKEVRISIDVKWTCTNDSIIHTGFNREHNSYLDSWSSYHYNGLTCYDVDLSITAEIDDEKLVYDYPYSSLPTPTVEPSHGPATKVY